MRRQLHGLVGLELGNLRVEWLVRLGRSTGGVAQFAQGAVGPWCRGAGCEGLPGGGEFAHMDKVTGTLHLAFKVGRGRGHG